MSLTHFQSANLPHGGLFLTPMLEGRLWNWLSSPPLQKVRFPDFW